MKEFLVNMALRTIIGGQVSILTLVFICTVLSLAKII
jgi:hypothetical protein